MQFTVTACLYAGVEVKTGGRQQGTPNEATLVKLARAQEGLRLGGGAGH
ncbi:MAG: hypothetical protein JO122_02255 [Acetobacteraceae bacterium]|nr:hypothetical protein [Acetobacteraceae bacterium]